MYSWYNVSKRTEVVYQHILSLPTPNLALRFVRYSTAGPWAGIIVMYMVAILHMACVVCEWVWPENTIEKCPDLQNNVGRTHKSIKSVTIKPT
jgi:hypothetical protein